MSYRFREGLHGVDVGGRAILLDLMADRYFAGKPRLNAALVEFLACDGGAGISDQTIQILSDACLIVKRDKLPTLHSSGCAVRPCHDLDIRASHSIAPILLGKAAILQFAYNAFPSRRRLSRVVLDVQRARSRITSPAAAEEDRYRLIAGCFERLEPIFPPANRCLQRTASFLALCHMLGCRPTFVVGVQASPFSAHCWVQDGDRVINDRLENVAPYVPILSV
jgi:hypothetical protein